MKEYQGFAISNFRTGFDEAVEPWLLPRDAYQILKNAHLYRGVLEKIPGYDIYAKMSYSETIVLTPAPDGVTTTFTGTLNHVPSTTQITAQAATNVGATTRETFIYGSDTPPDTINLVGSGGVGSDGTIDLNTLAVTLNFVVPPAIVPGGYNAVILTYDYLNPATDGTEDIMGIKPYYAQNGGQDILVFNTRRVGKVVTLSGLIASAAGSDNGIEEIPHEVQGEDVTVTPPFDGVVLTFTGTASAPIVPGMVNFVLYSNTGTVLTTITDNGIGLLTGTGTPTATGFISYATGNWTLTFSASPATTDTLNTNVCVYGDVFSGDYTNFFTVANYTFKAFITNGVDEIRYYDGMCLKYLNTNLTNRPGDTDYDISKCLHVAINRERLLLVAPTVQGVPQPNSIYWSEAFNPLNFVSDSNFLDAPTSESIRLFFFINSDMIVRFSNSERVFRYTGDFNAPFRWDSTNNIWRCDTRYSAINYDSFGTSVGKPAIVASDGVNVQRADEIIPDFTLNNRSLLEGPVISIDQTSIGQCYGERFDDFKEGWLCFREFDSTSSSIIQRSDNVLAFNYLDNTYAVYTFPFNCLGFGSVTSVDVWGNNFDQWGDANYSWGSFYESKDALIDLAGDRNGVVYTLGNTNTLTLPDGTVKPVLVDIISKNFNPFIEAGELCRFGYLDLFVSANNTSTLRVQFYRDDTMYEDAQGNPAGAYQETMLTFTTTDAMSPSTPQTKVWKRIYIGAVAREHTIRFYQNESDFTPEDLNQPVRIHAMILWMKPAGRVFN